MSRTRALLPSFLAAVAAACGGSQSVTPGLALRQPSGVAIFRGITIDDPAGLRPYLAVASAGRGEIALVDATDGTPVLAPIRLRTLVVPLPEGPSLLASASLGDGGADLLVVAAAGDTRVQLVHTWTVANEVEDAQAADLGLDVLAMAAVPSAAGTARIAAALADGGLALVEYSRQGSGIVLSSVAVNPLPFQPVSLAAVPGDPDHVYAATLDELAPGVFGVAEVDVSIPAAWTVRPLDARGPTRLVAAARLHERRPDSGADDASAFDLLQPPVSRVYAVLDESGCGRARRVDCGIAMLDPALALGRISDWAGRMPYRAPISVPARPIALAIAAPPAEPPSADAADAIYQDTLMRLHRGEAVLATTAVGAVAGDDGAVHILDLGRFKLATTSSPLALRAAGTPTATFANGYRLWIRKPAPDDTFPDASEASQFIEVTPGYTPDDVWTVAWQGPLPSLVQRAAEGGRSGPGQPWVALQAGEGPAVGPRVLSQVVRVYHPALGVAAGDIAVIRAAGIPGCEDPAEPSKEFEARIDALLEPTAQYPGGALALFNDPGQDDCVDRLEELVASEGLATRLSVTVRAGELVMTGAIAGYAGRPRLDERFALEYPTVPGGEDTLAAACPLADWDGALPAPACTGACTRAVCEELVLARKARRFHHVGEECGTDAECIARWPGLTFPIVNGPALAFRLGLQPEAGGTAPATPARDVSLRLAPAAGFAGLQARPSASASHPNGIVAFDRSSFDAAAGYRFLVSYPADFVLDTTPSVSPVESKIIR